MSAVLDAAQARVRRPLWRRPRAWGALAMALLLAAVLGGGYAGWYYSDELLQVDNAAGPYDTRVVAANGTSVTLTDTPGTRRDGTFGLVWATGSAVLGQVYASRGGVVSRAMQPLGGIPAAGTPARLDTSVWPGDPRSSRGLDFRTVRIPTRLGALPAWYVPGRGRTWAVLVHGRGSSFREGLRVLPALHRAGLPVLDISYRNDAGAPRSRDGLYHLGDTEWSDVSSAVSYALAAGAERIVLYGWSMGGAIVEAFLARSSYASRVRAVVLDAPVLDWRATLSLQARNRGLPQPLTSLAELIVQRRIGIDLDDFDVPAHASRVRVPTLVFHGAADATVPLGPARELAQERPQAVRLRVVPRADHTQSWNVDPVAYERTLAEFVAGVL